MPRRVTAAELRDVLAAAAALARAQLRVWTRPTGALVRASADTPTGADARRIEGQVLRAGAAVRRAARLSPVAPSCLVRSLALADVLARAGVPGGLIRLGVRRDGRALDAHAWVELDGRVIGDDPRHVGRFTPLGAVLPARRR